MAKAVLHVMKIKSAGDARRLAGHNNRSKPPANADPSRSARWLMPEPETDIWSRIESRVAALPKAKIRANSVQAVSVVLSASPEYFGDWKPGDEKTQAWIEASMSWLKAEFGDLAVGCWAHYDEKTPHLHVHIVPGTADGRLSAKERFGPRALARYQTEYAMALAPLGIERGLKGSRATHTPTRQWYADQAAAPVFRPAKVPEPPLLLRESARQQWAAEQNEKLIEKQKQQLLRTWGQAQGRQLAEKKAKEMAATAKVNEAAAEALKRERDMLRDIDLRRVLEASGWSRDPSDKNQWLHPGGSAAGRISLNGQKWYDHSASIGAGGAIDLAAHVCGLDFKGSVGWLRDNFGSDAATAAYRARAHEIAARKVETAPKAYTPPEPHPDGAPSLMHWLTNVRRIGSDLAQQALDAGAIYASATGRWLNAVFPFSKGMGAEIKGIAGSYKGNARGSSPGRDYWRFQTGPEPQRLIIAESPLDALSYHQLHPDCDAILVSTAGARYEPSLDLSDLAKQYADVVVAYDNDETGNAAGQKLAMRLNGRLEVPSAGKDWNEALVLSQRPEQSLSPAPASKPGSGPRL